LGDASTGLDENYVPPFPWCTVTVADPFKTKSVSRKGYIDTGSDGSIVPTKIGKELHLTQFPVMRIEAYSIGGKPEDRILYAAYVEINGAEVATAVDIRDDVNIILLGRDLLQYIKVTIDWKRKDIKILDP